MGAEAVMALMEADDSEPPCVVSLDGNQVYTHYYVNLQQLKILTYVIHIYVTCFRLFECH